MNNNTTSEIFSIGSFKQRAKGCDEFVEKDYKWNAQ